MADIASIGAYSENATFAWRGMRSIDYSYTSSLHRLHDGGSEDDLRRTEVAVLTEARSWGLGYGPGGWASDLQLLADLQHYGTSTRLIDVTSDPMTALWFACQDVNELDHTKSGVLVAIDTAGWDRFGRNQPTQTRSAANSPLSWELDRGLAADAPFIVHSLNPNDRLRAQNGYFLASRVPEATPRRTPFVSLKVEYSDVPHNYPRRLLDDMLQSTHSVTKVPMPFVAVRVRSHLKPRILQILANSYNKSHSALFPDFPGFRDYSKSATPRASNEEVDAKLTMRSK